MDLKIDYNLAPYCQTIAMHTIINLTGMHLYNNNCVQLLMWTVFNVEYNSFHTDEYQNPVPRDGKSSAKYTTNVAAVGWLLPW